MSDSSTTFKTLSDIIECRTRYDLDSIAFYKMNGVGDRVILDTTMFEIYDRLIRPYVMEYEVSNDERERYRYRPDALSLAVYGTPTLMWLILKLNDRECPSKFRIGNSVKLITPASLKTIFDILSTKSTDKLETNQRKYLARIGEEADGS